MAATTNLNINASATIFAGNVSSLLPQQGGSAEMFFHPAAPALSPGTVDYLADPNVSDFVNITRSFSRLTSPLAVTIAVLLVFLFSPMILIGNSLVLIATYRYKRLRTPSNYLVMSLASSDLGIGMFMPVGMYLELGGAHQWYGDRVCLLSYGVAISLCSVSVLVMVAIAVDRFTSLARPLRYNNLITHTAVERYIAVFWAYASLVGFTPLGYSLLYGSSQQQEASNNGDGGSTPASGPPSFMSPFADHDCSFGTLVSKPVQLFMFCAVYGPSALILVLCYGYIYVIARGHARAISGVRHSLHYHQKRKGSQQHSSQNNKRQKANNKDTATAITLTITNKDNTNNLTVGNGTLITSSRSTEFISPNRSERRVERRGGGSFRESGNARGVEECNGSPNTSSGNNNGHHVAGPPRYGLALAITTGMFLALWVPFQACMLMDVFLGTTILSNWVAVYLALPILASSAFNPWVYGYRNAELRAAVRRVVDDLLTALGFTYRSHQVSDPIAPSAIATAGDPGSHLNQPTTLQHHQKHLHHPMSAQNGLQVPLFSAHATAHCYSCRGAESPVTVTGAAGDFLLVPIARPESSGVLSEGDLSKVIWHDLWPATAIGTTTLTSHPGHAHSAVLITTELPPRLVLKSSRSMVESFVVSRSSGSLGDVLIIKRGGGEQVNMLNCSSAV